MSKHKWAVRCTPPRGLVRPVPVDPGGVIGPTKNQARGPKWQMTTRGLYVPTGTDRELPEQRILEQGMRLPTGGAVSAWAACRLHGANFMDGLAGDGRTQFPVPLALGTSGNIRRSPHVTLIHDPLPDSEITSVAGIPVVTAERAVFDAIRLARTARDAVGYLDTCVAAGLTSIERIATYVSERSGRRGVGKARFAVRHGRERVWSLRETALRLIAERDAGLPRFLGNCPIHDRRGRLLGIADLLDEEAGLVIEFDGAGHRDAGQHTHDVGKDDDLRRVGLEVARGDRQRSAQLRPGGAPSATGARSCQLFVFRRSGVGATADCAERELREQEDLQAFYAEQHAAYVDLSPPA